MAVENKARIYAVMGQSGTGKGLWIKWMLRREKPKRILFLDPQDEYGEFAPAVTTAAALTAAVIKGGKSGAFAVRYVFPKTCTPDHFARVFDLACRLVYAAGNSTFLVEELSNFTTASWGPPLWRRMCNSGRHEGVWVIGCSQYPAQVDKAFMSNATLVHCGWLGEEPHRKSVAIKMNVSADLINSLPDLEYLEWKREDRSLHRGRVSFTGQVTQKPVPPSELRARAARAVDVEPTTATRPVGKKPVPTRAVGKKTVAKSTKKST